MNKITTRRTTTEPQRRGRAALALAVLLVMATAACESEEAAPPPPTAADGAPLTAELRATLEASPELRELRARLASTGDTVSLDEARVLEQGDKQGILCPVSGPDGQPGQFSQVAVQRRQGGALSLSLEPNQQHSPLTGAPRDEALRAAGIQCEPSWFPGRVIGSFCEWSVACWFGDATYHVQEHVRTCCAAGVGCWEERQNFEVRAHCGC